MFQKIQNSIQKNKTLLLLFFLFLMVRLVILFFFPIHISDLHFFFEKATRGVLQGLQTYQDFTFPYPPLAIPFFYLPIYFGQTFEAYRFYFQMEMFAFDCLSFFYLYAIIKNRLKFSKNQIYSTLGVFTYFGLFAGLLIYDRLDVVMVTSILMILYYYLSPNPRYRLLAYFIASLATVIKVIPIFLVPILWILDSTKKKQCFEIKKLFLPLTIYFLPIIIFMGIFHIHTHGNIWRSLAEHKARGIQIESTWATPFMIKNIFSPSSTEHVITIYGAQHLVESSIPKWYLFFSKYFGFFFLFFFYIFFFLKRLLSGHPNKPTPYQVFGIFFSILLFLLLSERVLSPQYFLWILPFMSIYMIKKSTKSALFLVTFLYILTFVGFKWYNNFMHFSPVMVSIVALRNFLLITFGFFLIHEHLFSKKRIHPLNDKHQQVKEV